MKLSTSINVRRREVIGFDPCPDGMRRRFVAYFHFVGWDCISLGFHVALHQQNIELHVPFGFFRIGWQQPWRLID